MGNKPKKKTPENMYIYMYVLYRGRKLIFTVHGDTPVGIVCVEP